MTVFRIDNHQYYDSRHNNRTQYYDEYIQQNAHRFHCLFIKIPPNEENNTINNNNRNKSRSACCL